jgi:hypothetical protein
MLLRHVFLGLALVAAVLTTGCGRKNCCCYPPPACPAPCCPAPAFGDAVGPAPTAAFASPGCASCR